MPKISSGYISISKENCESVSLTRRYLVLSCLLRKHIGLIGNEKDKRVVMFLFHKTIDLDFTLHVVFIYT